MEHLAELGARCGPTLLKVKKPVALYARVSVATDESVSVARQLASRRKYAAARGSAGGG
jgi:hypothetical protein